MTADISRPNRVQALFNGDNSPGNISAKTRKAADIHKAQYLGPFPDHMGSIATIKKKPLMTQPNMRSDEPGG
ncbi:hypothetical protein D3871_13195 [Noviherbaspirillum saxi]|uniref:Uncharacterized protein n=1 Tax=Noviherbaspirillum saxi TaxID=2320863 RepID=A0A3A3FYT5_9BURK|nr:hypothetical protein D3871_13195 [Noviherbaspirillum saxi]